MKSKFNFLNPRTSGTPVKETSPTVRVRASGRDQYAGQRGHAYIKARNLGVHFKHRDDEIPPSHPSWLSK